MSGGRGIAFHCPYCGDQDLRPGDRGPGSWECHACLRVFSLQMHGMLPRPALGANQSPPTTPEEMPR